MSTRMDRRVAIAALLAPLLVPQRLWAEDYPVRPIKFVVPFPAGGPADLFARLLTNRLAADLGQPFVIENRAGVGGLAGVEAVVKSTPDGYTIGLSSSSALSIYPFMVSRMPFDWSKDLTLLTLVVRVPEVLVVLPSLHLSTLQELVDHARAHPHTISFGSAGTGSITHLAGELLKTEAKIDLVHVPYRGANPAVNDLLGGHIHMAVLDVPILLPHIRSGALKALAVTSRERSAALPDVPTTAEAGFKSVLSDNWYGLVAPAGLPASVASKLATATIAALRSAELKKQFAAQDAVTSPSSAEEFAAFVVTEQAKWGPIVAATGAKLE